MRLVFAMVLALVMTGCASPEARLQTANEIAQRADLRAISVTAPPFTLAAYVRNSDPSNPVVIYIEGDGLAWISRSQPSLDPTPRNPVGLRLAAEDHGPNVIYLARPCQYVRAAACDVTYWTDRRFAEDVIRSTSAAIDALIRPGQHIHLVGYSGGGAVAAMIAARRADVLSLRTVAGNLDHDALSLYHDVSPMVGSLNPRDVAQQLVGLPQFHYVGDRDKVVPPLVSASYLHAMGDTRCAAMIHVGGASHDDGWVEFWRDAAKRMPKCRFPA